MRVRSISLPERLTILCARSISRSKCLITGSEIELDRVVLEEIGDPLIHLLRNAIDHGIESPEERQAKGKDPKGKIAIKVSRQKGQISIEISDNGRGVSVAKVKEKAIKKGIILFNPYSLERNISCED